MSLVVHCGTVMDHITGKLHCTSEPGRTACWMHNSLSQNTQNQLGALLSVHRVFVCVCVSVCSRPFGYSYGNIWERNYKSQCWAKVNHYSCESDRWNSGAAGVMNEIFTSILDCMNCFSSCRWEFGKAMKQYVVNTIPCLLQALGYQALLYTNTVLLYCNSGEMQMEQECNR